MSANSLLLLDTNVLLHLVRGKATGLALDKAFGVRTRPDKPLISVVTVGEMMALATRLNWGPKKVADLKHVAEQLVVVDIRNQTVLEKYAEIDDFLVRHGRKVGDNDIWIAATAAVSGAHLLTSDKDFDPLHNVFLTRIYYDLDVVPAAN
jgi:tRNA(fMet)-specific endonuclease VapC